MNSKWLLVIFAILLATTPVNSIVKYEYTRVLEIYAPAVSSSGRGVISKITIGIAYPGSGRVFFSALPYTEVDTQGAARVAAFIASVIARADFSSYDYYVLVESNTPIIGGPSAGALFAVGFTALLLDLHLNSSVTMTGMINPDGTIGPVGGLKEKLEAAASSGFKVFLVPSGQRIYSYPVYEEATIGWVTIRRVTYRVIDLVEYGKNLGISVVEVSTVLDALYYFTGVEFRANTTSTRINLSPELTGLLSRRLSEIYNTTTTYISFANSIISEIKISYYRYYYAETISYLNNTATKLLERSKEHPTYSLFRLLDLYERSLYTYLELSLITGRTSVEDITNNLLQALSDYSRGVADTCTIEMSLARAHLNLAWYYYSQAVLALNSSGLTEALNRIARSYRNLLEFTIYRDINSEDGPGISCTPRKLIQVYSNALASSVYVTRILSELGASLPSSAINLLNDYINTAQYMSERNETGLIGISALILAQTSLLLHQALNDINRVFELEGLLGVYTDRRTPVYDLYLDLASSARSVGDSELYYKAILYSVAIVQVLSQVCSTFKDALNTARTPSSQSTYTQLSTTTPSNHSDAVSTTGGGVARTRSYVDVVIVILTVVAIVVLLLRLSSRSTGVPT